MSKDDVNKKNVIVVGAGPSGCSAAISAKKEGHNVLLVESRKRQSIVQNGRSSFEAFQNLTYKGDAIDFLSGFGLNVKPEYVYRGAKVFGPSGTGIDIRMKRAHGYFIRRRGKGSLDHQLIERCEEIGIDIRFDTRTFWSKESGELILEGPEESRKLRANIIIGADGLGTSIGKDIVSTLRIEDMAVGVGYQFKGKHKFEKGIAECWLGSLLCPGEYAYILPAENEVSVVTTMRPHLMKKGSKPKDYLDRFCNIPSVKERLGDSRIVNMIKGGVPVTGGGPLGRGRILLVGEAARSTDPLLGFGMINAMRSGYLAGKSVSEKDPLGFYRRSMEEEIMPDLRSRMNKRISILDKLDDNDLDRIVDVMRTITEKVEPDLFFNRKTRKKALLSSFPSLVMGGGIQTTAKYLIPFLYSNFSL